MGESEFKLGRPNIVTIFLWISAVAILAMTVYVAVTWQGPVTMRDHLLLLLAASSSLTQIAVGALIDMHTIRPMHACISSKRARDLKVRV